MACICVTDHAEARVEVKVVSNRCVHVLSSSLIVEVLFLEMEPPTKRRIHRPCFQDSWKTGRPWLVYDMETKKMTCSWCDALPWQSCQLWPRGECLDNRRRREIEGGLTGSYYNDIVGLRRCRKLIFFRQRRVTTAASTRAELS